MTHHPPHLDRRQWGSDYIVADSEVWFGSLEDVDTSQPVLVSNEDGTYTHCRRRADGTIIPDELEGNS